MSVGTIQVPLCDDACGELETVCAVDDPPACLTGVEGMVRVASRVEWLSKVAAGIAADIEADIADGRLLRAPDIARRARELRADIAALGARDLGATYVTEIGGESTPCT